MDEKVRMSTNLPPFPGKEGDVFYDEKQGIFYFYTNECWVPLSIKSSDSFDSSHIQELSAIDRVMLEFERIVNNHADMNVRLRWYTELERKQHPDKQLNHPDFWLGVAWAAYQKQVITKDMFMDILLVMQALGAESKYFHQIKRLAAEGKL
jgi:hypothetical protein